MSDDNMLQNAAEPTPSDSTPLHEENTNDASKNIEVPMPTRKRKPTEYHPTTLKFKEKSLLSEIDALGEKVDLNRRQLVELAVARLLYDYEKTGHAALLKPARMKKTE